jgi:hypothetical protein
MPGSSPLPEPQGWLGNSGRGDREPITAPQPVIGGGPVGSAIIRAEKAADAQRRPSQDENGSLPADADERPRRFGLRRTRGQPSL